MNEAEFIDFMHEVESKEAVLDGKCSHLRRFGGFDRYLMERFGLIRYAGNKGLTRIVIEYDNDTGKGWMRAVSEDQGYAPIPKEHSEQSPH